MKINEFMTENNYFDEIIETEEIDKQSDFDKFPYYFALFGLFCIGLIFGVILFNL